MVRVTEEKCKECSHDRVCKMRGELSGILHILHETIDSDLADLTITVDFDCQDYDFLKEAPS